MVSRSSQVFGATLEVTNKDWTLVADFKREEVHKGAVLAVPQASADFMSHGLISLTQCEKQLRLKEITSFPKMAVCQYCSVPLLTLTAY